MAQFIAKHCRFLGIKGEVGVWPPLFDPECGTRCGECVIPRQPSVGHLCIMTLLTLYRVVTICTTFSYIQELCALPPVCCCVFQADPRIKFCKYYLCLRCGESLRPSTNRFVFTARYGLDI
jgi:hypothetical protein